MGIKDRLRRLEGGDSCTVCCWGPDMEIEVTWEDGWDDDLNPKEPEPVEPEYCEACGRPDVIIIRWEEDLDKHQRRSGANTKKPSKGREGLGRGNGD